MKKYLKPMFVFLLLFMICMSGCSVNKWEKVEPNGEVYEDPNNTESIRPRSENPEPSKEYPPDRTLDEFVKTESNESFSLVLEKCQYIGQTNSVVLKGSAHAFKDTTAKIHIIVYNYDKVLSESTLNIEMDKDQLSSFAIEARLEGEDYKDISEIILKGE